MGNTAESIKLMLAWVYGVGLGTSWEYTPSSAEVNKDMLRLARHFGFPHLHEFAARRLTKGLTTSNVVERLVTCEEFGLGLLREKIIQQLTLNPAELTVVSSSLEIMKHPRILQDLLMAVASLCGVPKPAKKEEKAEEKADKEKSDKDKSDTEKEKSDTEKVEKEKSDKKKKEEQPEKQPEPVEEPVKKTTDKSIEKKADKVKQEKVEPAVPEKPVNDKVGKRKGEAAVSEPVAPAGKKQKKGSTA